MDKQKKIVIYSVLFGVGVGMTVTSLVNYLNPQTKYKEYNESQIRQMAYEFGMIDPNDYEIIDISTEDNNLNKTRENIGEDNQQQEESNNNSSQESLRSFEIKKGEVSETIISNLANAGIVDNEEEFSKLVEEKDAEKRFKFGIYEIPVDSDYETIIDILCGDIEFVN